MDSISPESVVSLVDVESLSARMVEKCIREVELSPSTDQPLVDEKLAGTWRLRVVRDKCAAAMLPISLRANQTTDHVQFHMQPSITGEFTTVRVDWGFGASSHQATLRHLTGRAGFFRERSMHTEGLAKPCQLVVTHLTKDLLVIRKGTQGLYVLQRGGWWDDYAGI